MGQNKVVNQGLFNLKNTAVLCVIIFLTIVCFWPVLKNDFTNWDDDFHITANPHVRMPTLSALKPIFTTTVNDTYIPLTELTFNIEYQLFKFNPVVCHAINLFLHLIVIATIFFFGLELGLPLFASAMASLVFGIHPMHVESVSWLTQRKDLLYSMFYLLSLWNYWMFIKNNKKLSYVASIVFAALSILSKPMALSLPLILFLLDWLNQRKFTFRTLIEKLPYLLVIIPMTLLTYVHFVRVPIKNLLEAALIWVWSFVFYIFKFIFPATLMPIYSFPQPIALSNGVFLGSLIGLVILAGFIFYFRKDKWFCFAFLFYFLSIFFLLRFDFRDLHVVADRFMYLPSLGICFLIGQASKHFLTDSRRWVRNTFFILGLCVFILLGVKTNQQCKVWKNSQVFWDTVIQTNPLFPPAYLHRADIYIESKEFDKALKDINQAILIYPGYARAYNNRAAVLNSLGLTDLVLADLNQSIVLDPAQIRAYQNRAAFYKLKGNFDLAIADYQLAISKSPFDANLYNDRGLLYMHLGKGDLALLDFNQAINLDSYRLMFYLNRANFYKETKQYSLAVKDFNRIIQMEPGNYSFINDRAVVYRLMGDLNQAIADFTQAIYLQPNKFSYYNRANAYLSIGDSAAALKDYDEAIKIDANFKEAVSNRAILINKSLNIR